MSISDLLSKINLGSIAATGGIVLLIVMTVIQISPIKINPWSWIAKRIGRAINQEVIDKVDKLEKDVATIKANEDEREATLCRTRILRFGDELLHGVKHSKEHFDQILIDITYYENYCSTHAAYRNNVAVLTIQQVKETYRKCMRDKTFL